MLNQREYEKLFEPIISIYREIETRLIKEVAKSFDNYNGVISGSLEWQLIKLQQMGSLNTRAVKIIAEYSKLMEKTVEKIIKDAMFANMPFDELDKAFNKNISDINAEMLQNSPSYERIIKGTKDTIVQHNLQAIQRNALNGVQNAYTTVVNTAYVETASGIRSYDESIARACQELAKKGIVSMQYQTGNKIKTYSIEGLVRRDVITTVNQLSNATVIQSINDIGTDFVEVSQHLGARVSFIDQQANHAGWQGGVYKIHGNEKNYRNLGQVTGYPYNPLGLGGYCCRHRIFPFWIGISKKKPIMYTLAENWEMQKLTKHQRSRERAIRNTKRELEVLKALPQTDETKTRLRILKKRLDNQCNLLNKFCDSNGLKRDFSRERIYLQIGKKR